MLLQKEDKEFLEKISSICKHDKTVVYEVIKSLLFCYTHELYKGIEDPTYSPQIVIPFICTLTVDYKDEVTSRGVLTKVNLTAEPQDALIDEINRISENQITPTEKLILKQIEAKFNKILKVEKDEMDCI